MSYTVTIVGAAGKMGTRCTNNLVKEDYKLLLCEKGEKGVEKLQERGFKITPSEEAVPRTDIVVMAVPDVVLGNVAQKIVPMLKEGTTMIMLDPAVAYAGGIPLRKNVSYVVTHPCHPSLFKEQTTPEAREDIFGGIAAVQDIVIALIHGSEENFQEARKLCCRIFAPVENCHRVSLEQMAMLEPALSEVIGATAASILKKAVDVAAKYGVPREAAKAFILGHINIELAVAFGVIDSPLSDAAQVAVKLGKRWVFQSDWEKVFKPEMVHRAVDFMLHPEKLKK
ncbi:oxidoreductase [Candidatus Aerophobetes bacterium]|uniref:Oxidoreductase n=1 Tax=Aerophobetes bacterium TaxID=2030807 RepID=A0A523RSQ1_UNCAE|nr:MAG: oxidoreductase [Candidatus Aerophobetes bacterium]